MSDPYEEPAEGPRAWISTRRLEQCQHCRYQCSVTAGTVFRVDQA